MRVLLANVPAKRLGALSGHDVSTFDGDPCDRSAAEAATKGVDAVVCGFRESSAGDPLPALDHASRGIYNLITTAASAKRFVLLSSMRMFERYPLDYQISEYWAPRPTAEPADLVPFTAEGVVREAAHTLPLKAICLRLDSALHEEDATQAVEKALSFEPDPIDNQTGWWVFHIVGAGKTSFPLALAGKRGDSNGRRGTLGYSPKHEAASADRVFLQKHTPGKEREGGNGPRLGGWAGPKPIRRVVIFGAGGPLAAITADHLHRDHVLRLADKRPLAEVVAGGRPQSRGAPFPRLYDAPHETRVVDVTDYAQVLEATRGMDAVMNMTVIRPDPVEAFRVNTLGAYNVIKAALECGIRRVVQTGPQQVTNTMPGGYWADFSLSSDVPQRPGVALYFISKFLGQEIMRVFAEEHGMEVPTLVFGPFTNPDDCEPSDLGCYPFLVSWSDAAEALRGALRAPSFDRPFEVFHITADLPHGKYRTERAKKALHWQPRDDLTVHWRRAPQ